MSSGQDKTDDCLRGFAPLADGSARALVLGSMPGQASLAEQRYYAHARNAFWPIMGELFDAGPELAYAERCRRLCHAGLALWDVVACCRREGSLDSRIEMDSVEVNNFAQFFHRHPKIRMIYFNGSRAEQLYRRLVTGVPVLPQQRLPSTSPAYASQTLAQKCQQWRVLHAALSVPVGGL